MSIWIYTHIPRYFFFCSGFPAIIIGMDPNPFASIAVMIPVQPYAIFSVIKQPSKVPNPMPRKMKMLILIQLCGSSRHTRWFIVLLLFSYLQIPVIYASSSNPIHVPFSTLAMDILQFYRNVEHLELFLLSWNDQPNQATTKESHTEWNNY